jgi:hypothetical protein
MPATSGARWSNWSATPHGGTEHETHQSQGRARTRPITHADSQVQLGAGQGGITLSVYGKDRRYTIELSQAEIEKAARFANRVWGDYAKGSMP